MSDVWQGPGWWIASDGKWYPPDKRSSTQGPPPPQTQWNVPSDSAFETPNAPGLEPPAARSEPQESRWPATDVPSQQSQRSAASPPDTVISSGSGRPKRIVGKGKALLGLAGLVLILGALSPVFLASSPAPVKGALQGQASLSGGTPAQSSTPSTSPTSSQSVDWLASHATPAETVAMAKSIASSIWTRRNQALVGGDTRMLASIESGDALKVDLYAVYLAECGCRQAFKPGAISSLQVLVPQQTTYPLDFMAAYLIAASTNPELMVFTKASANAEWLVSLDTVGLNQFTMPLAPAISGEPSGIVSNLTSSSGTQVMQELVSYLNATQNAPTAANEQSSLFSTNAAEIPDNAGVPPSGPFTGSPPYSSSSAASSPSPSGVWSFPVSGLESGASTISCGSIEDTTTSSITTTAPLVQQGSTFGPYLSSGSYKTIVGVTGIETCVVGLSNGRLDIFGSSGGQIAESGTPAT